jgi:predicted DNA binding CopG/RHH family protein
MLVGKKSTILTVAIPNDLMEIVKKEAERKRVGYSTLIRMIIAEALSKGESHDKSV